jgi:phage gpG-like protein
VITYKLDQRQLNEILKATNKEDYKRAIDVSLFNIGEEMSGKAKEQAPYDKGDLRRSITSEVTSGKHVEVGTDKVYARIHEFGGKTGRGHRVNITARPYLMPQYDIMAGGRAIDIILKHFGKFIK